MPTRGEVRLIHFTPSFITTFPVQVFAFTCAQNVSGKQSGATAFIHKVNADFPPL
jgi:amino acid permease